MDKAFIEKHQIFERYLTGKLPFKGVQDFERYCRENPQILEDIRFADAVNKGLRLLEAGGRPAELEERKPQWWQRSATTYGLLAVVVILAIVGWLLFDRTRELQEQVAALETRLDVGPLRPPAGTRPVRITPDRSPTNRMHLTLQPGERPELLDMRVDVSFARLNAFRVTIDKQDQARVGTIHNLLRDSNGQLRVTVNTSSLHRGVYKVTIAGVTMRGQLVPVAWFNLRVAG